MAQIVIELRDKATVEQDLENLRQCLSQLPYDVVKAIAFSATPHENAAGHLGLVTDVKITTDEAYRAVVSKAVEAAGFKLRKTTLFVVVAPDGGPAKWCNAKGVYLDRSLAGNFIDDEQIADAKIREETIDGVVRRGDTIYLVEAYRQPDNIRYFAGLSLDHAEAMLRAGPNGNAPATKIR